MKESQCHKCGAPVRLRLPREGQTWKPFFGCSSYPNCNASSPAFKSGASYVHVSAIPTDSLKERIERLQSQGYVSRSTVSFYLSCPGPNGDMAMDAFDRECDYIFDEATVHPLLDVMEAELARRGQ